MEGGRGDRGIFREIYSPLVVADPGFVFTSHVGRTDPSPPLLVVKGLLVQHCIDTCNCKTLQVKQ